MKNASQITLFGDLPASPENQGVGVRLKSLKKKTQENIPPVKEDKPPAEGLQTDKLVAPDADMVTSESSAGNPTVSTLPAVDADLMSDSTPGNTLPEEEEIIDRATLADQSFVHRETDVNDLTISADNEIQPPNESHIDLAGDVGGAAMDRHNVTEQPDNTVPGELSNIGTEQPIYSATNKHSESVIDEQLSGETERLNNTVTEEQGNIVTEQPVTDIAEEEPIAITLELSAGTAEEEISDESSPAGIPKSQRGRKSLKNIESGADLINIPPDEELFKKQYYAIGEVAEMFHVNQSLIRFWETEFDIIQPRKNRKGDRHFRPVDIKNLLLIHDLLRRRKLTIEGAKDFLKKNKRSPERFAMIQSLQQIRAFILEVKATL